MTLFERLQRLGVLTPALFERLARRALDQVETLFGVRAPLLMLKLERLERLRLLAAALLERLARAAFDLSDLLLEALALSALVIALRLGLLERRPQLRYLAVRARAHVLARCVALALGLREIARRALGLEPSGLELLLDVQPCAQLLLDLPASVGDLALGLAEVAGPAPGVRLRLRELCLAQLSGGARAPPLS